MNNKANGKGPWSFEEDNILLEWVNQNGPQKWSLCSETIPGRSGKQCRERWFNNLNPNVKKGNWAAEEDDMIFKGYLQFGSSWSRIAKNLEGRTENSVKNRFYSTVRKLLSDSEKNGVKTSEQQIRNIIEMSLGQKVGGIQSKDVDDDEDSLEGGNNSQFKNEEEEQQQQGKSKEQQEQDGFKNIELTDNKNEQLISQNIKQEHDVITTNATPQEQVSIPNQVSKETESNNQIISNVQANLQQLQDNQLDDAVQQNNIEEEMSSNPSSQQEVTKRKYNRKRHQDEYSESNLLYRLLKSNDVAIKSSKCLQDYSVFYRKYKQNKYDDKKKSRNGETQEEDDDRSGLGDIEAGNNNNSCDESEVKQSSKQNIQKNQNSRDIKGSNSKKEKKNNIQEQAITGENSRKKIKTNEPENKHQQVDLQDCDDSQSDPDDLGKLDKIPDLEDSDIESSSQKMNQQDQDDNDQEDQEMQFGEMESQLIKYFQKSMGQFLKNFLKKSKTGSQGSSNIASSKEMSNKNKKNRSKSKSIVSQMQSQQQQSNQVFLQNQIKEQISKQFEKLKGTTLQQTSSQSSLETPDELKPLKNLTDIKKTNKITTIISESQSNKVQSSIPLKKTTQNKQEDTTTTNSKQQQSKQQQSYVSQNHQELNPQLSESSGGQNYSNPQIANPPMNANFQSSKSSFVLNKNSTHLSQQSLHKIGSSSSLNSQPLNNNQNSGQPTQNNIINNPPFGINPLPSNLAQKVQPAPIVPQNLDIESLKNLINNNLLVNKASGQQSSSAAPNSQVDQKMLFLLNQLCTLESMLTNTKQELVKLEESLYQQAPNPISTQNVGRISNSQNNLHIFNSFDQQLQGNGGAMPSAGLSLNHLPSFNSKNNFERNENNIDLLLKRQNSKDNNNNKDNVSQYSDFDKFINHGS